MARARNESAPGEATTAVNAFAPLGLGLRGWTRILPSLLLMTIALHQIVRATAGDLEPWKGGGFGMFASTDGGSTRRVRAWAETPNGRVALYLYGDVGNLRQRARALPDARRLDDLARALVPIAMERAPEATALKVEVWRIEFSHDRLVLSGRRLGQVRRSLVSVAGGG